MVLTLFMTTLVLILALIGFTYSKPEHRSYQISLGVILVGGLLIYSYIYHQTETNALLVPLQAAWAVIKMFTGGQEYSRALQTELFQNLLMQLVFWLVHAFALYITASATVKLLGQSLIRQFNLWKNRNQPVSLIFGLNQDSLAFAKKLEKEGTVIYFDKSSSDFSDKLKSDKTKSVIIGEIDDTVLKKYHITDERTKISSYALSDDYEANIKFAESLKGLKGKVHLTLMGDEEDYLKHPNFDDFAGIYVTNPLTLSARQLIQQSPPYQVMNFNNGKANNDFHLLQIGFGHIGQEVLKQVYMNAQFVGSQFKADIFSPDVTDNTGRIRATTNFIDDEGITLHSNKCESLEFYNFIKDNQSSVTYIVISTGDSERNREFARHLSQIFGNTPIHIVQTDGVYKGSEFYSNFDKELLDSDTLDEKAKLVNCAYYGHEFEKADEDWKGLKYFHRMSNRASADFTGAIVKASGLFEKADAQVYVLEDWNDRIKSNDELYDNLGRMEHLRWNAFYKVMGYYPMSHETVRKRASEWREKGKEKKFKKYITDDEESQHACLVSWEELISLDRLIKDLVNKYDVEPSKKGDSRPYQEADYEIIKIIAELYKSKEEV